MKAGITTEALALLQRLAAAGELKPETVVQHAADTDSPLHAYFTWDDAVAAAKHRIEEARSLIRSVRIEVTVNEITLHAPRYVHDPAQGRNAGYVETLSIKSDEERARAVIQAELARAVAHLERANHVAAALGREHEVAGLIQQAVGLSKSIEIETNDLAAE